MQIQALQNQSKVAVLCKNHRIIMVLLFSILDNLIKRFMDSTIDKEPESFGEVNLMIELKQNPGADKLLNVKVLTAEGLQYKATSFRPYISLDIIGPGMKNFKRNGDSPVFQNCTHK